MTRFSRFSFAAFSRLLCYLLCFTLIFSSVPFVATTAKPKAAGQGQAEIFGKLAKPVNGRVKKTDVPKIEEPTESTQCSRRDKACRKLKEGKDAKKADKVSYVPTHNANSADRLFASLKLPQTPFDWKGNLLTWLDETSEDRNQTIADVPAFAPVSFSATTTTMAVQSGYSLTVAAPTTVPTGAIITLNWVAPSNHSTTDWIALYFTSETNNQLYVDFKYVPAGASGTLTFYAPYDEGSYQFRYLPNNDYIDVARSNTLTIFSLEFPAERLDPINRIGTGGEDLLSGNYNWATSLVNLPGRAGLDLNLTLHYNSLVWTKSATQPYIGFDSDIGFPSPGFQLGFPILQGPYVRAINGVQTPYYLLSLPSGRRIELRNEIPGMPQQSSTFLSTDSSHLRMVLSGSFYGMTVFTPDGTRMFFTPQSRGYECQRITDRNGNYLSITYNTNGNITSVIDTLGRKINFIYDQYSHLIKLTQDWNNNTNAADDHVWATFSWTNRNISTNFPGLTVGGLGGTSIPVISKVVLDNGSEYRFTYTNWGQVKTIEQWAGGTGGMLLSTRNYNLPTTLSPGQTDCPRFTQRADQEYVYYGDSFTYNYAWNQSAPSVCTGCVTGQVTVPDGTTICETYAMNNWQRGLLMKAATKETSSAATEKKKTFFTWTQDAPTALNQYNPRVIETNVYDDVSPTPNRRRTETVYKAGTGVVPTYVKLPDMIKEYDATATAVYRTTQLKYLHETDTTNAPQYVQLTGNQGTLDFNITTSTMRWLVGLVTERCLYEGGTISNANLRSKVKQYYDDSGEHLIHQAAKNHSIAGVHTTTYGTVAFRWRGNITRTERWDATAPTDATKAVTSKIGYNTTGSPVFTRDAVGAQTDISYLDNFSDTAYNTNTNLAYPTKVTDPDGRLAMPQFFSTASFDYNIGAVKQSAAPKRAQDAAPVTLTYTYDTARRVTRVENSVDPTNLYTRHVYSPFFDYASVYTKIDAGQPETYTHTYFDGFGRVGAIEKDFPTKDSNNQALQSSSLVAYQYDNMGRISGQSNPTEVDPTNLLPTNSDSLFYLTGQTYDWQGRPRITTNQDGTTRQTTYAGCGCAGGLVATTTDERGRTKDVTYDFLGRSKQERTYYWGGSNGTNVYSTTDKTYNVRDQLETSTTNGQITSLRYDGHARLKEQELPIFHGAQQSASPWNKYEYNADDTLQCMTDPRGIKATYTYNKRKLIKSIDYDEMSNTSSAPSADVSYEYDEHGNRSLMNDSLGSVNYQYNPLGRLTAETRNLTFFLNQSQTPTPKSYTLSYEYTLSGQLKNIFDPWQGTTTYTYNRIGQAVKLETTAAGSATVILVDNVKYRAWGGLNSFKNGNIPSRQNFAFGYSSRLQLTSYDGNARSTTNTYWDDGKLKDVSDLYYTDFNRKHTYDHVGRLKTAKGGSIANPTKTFNYTYQYDAHGNSGMSGHHWNQIVGHLPQWSNDRETTPGKIYDYAGNITQSFSDAFFYDSKQRLTYSYKYYGINASGVTEFFQTFFKYDGDNNKLITVNSIIGDPGIVELASTPLGGRSVVGVDPKTGTGTTTDLAGRQFYFNGEVIAQQTVPVSGTPSIRWLSRNPVTQSRVVDTGGQSPEAEGLYDPTGSTLGRLDPHPHPILVDPPSVSQFSGWPEDYGKNCYLDGIPTDCNTVTGILNRGAGTLNTRESQINSFPQPGGFAVVGGIVDADGPNEGVWGTLPAWKIIGRLQNNGGRQQSPSTQGITKVPCASIIPTDPNERAVWNTLMGESEAVQTSFTSEQLKRPGNGKYGPDQAGKDAYNSPNAGLVSSTDVYRGMILMVDVIQNRLTDERRFRGKSWSDVVTATYVENGKEKYEFEGYPYGANLTQLDLGYNDSEPCIRSYQANNALRHFKDFGVTNRNIHNWRGIKQGAWIRPINGTKSNPTPGAIRVANTDFF